MVTYRRSFKLLNFELNLKSFYADNPGISSCIADREQNPPQLPTQRLLSGIDDHRRNQIFSRGFAFIMLNYNLTQLYSIAFETRRDCAYNQGKGRRTVGRTAVLVESSQKRHQKSDFMAQEAAFNARREI
jgi:hypothetical protein